MKFNGKTLFAFLEMTGADEEAYEAGKTAEWGAFWDAYQMLGTRRDYASAFTGNGWNDVTFKPKYDIIATGNVYGVFSYGLMSEINVVLDFTGATSIGSAFASCNKLKTVAHFKPPYNLAVSFSKSGCPKLENLTIESEIGTTFTANAPLLTHKSLMSIINHLAIVSTAQTLTLGETNLAKLTDTEKAIATEKGWTLV